MKSTILLRGAAAAAVSVLVLAGCGDSDDSGAPATRTDDAQVDQAAAEAASLSLEDPYVKAADSGMTAAFGTLVNDGPSDITVVSASSEITDAVELHETVAGDTGEMMMQPKKGGFTIAAGETHELSPGGDHLMVMDLTRPLEPGEDVTITLTLDDGSTVDVVATVKDVAGGDEEYMGDTDMGDTPESVPSP